MRRYKMSEISKPIMLDETGQRIADALEQMADNKIAMTITAIASDSVSVAGQEIIIKDVTNNLVYKRFNYSGQPEIIEVPYGMAYRVETNVTLSMHYCDDLVVGIADADKTILLTYKTLASISTFPALKSALNAGLGRYITPEMEISFTHEKEGVMTFNPISYNPDTETVELLLNRTLTDQKQFDTPEALGQASSEMPAGNYTFKSGSTSYYFTLTQAIPQGGQFRCTTTAFQTYASPYDTIAIETGSVGTTALSGATDLGTSGSGMLNHMDRVNFGSNDGGESNLIRWLMSDGDADDWWEPQTMFDRPPSFTNADGFLKGVPQEVLDVVDTSDVAFGTNSTYVAPDSQHTKSGVYTMQMKFFLPSEANMFSTSTMPDGTKQYKFLIGQPDSVKIRRHNGSARLWWLRSPHSNAYSVRYVRTNGSSHSNHAYNDYGVVPACRISKSVIE